MADITKLNFMEMLPQVEEAIKSANFIAIDVEFTGLNLGPENDFRLFESLQERYMKMKECASNFVPCQIGLTMFSKSKSKNEYNAETFTFYVRPYMCCSTDKRFMLQASCINFLNKYDFDFNKFLKFGIPYINELEEQQIVKEIEDGTIGYGHKRLQEHKYKKDLDVLINNKLMNKSQEVEASFFASTEENKLIIPIDEVSHEYFQVTEIRHKYPTLWAYSEKDMIIIERVSSEKRKELINSCKENEKFLEYNIGFTKVFRLLRDCKKPIVGHNLLMDLLLFFQNFHKPLPDTYKKFKKELHAVFPTIYDTRHIWLHVTKFYQLKNITRQSSLFDLYEVFLNTPDALCTLFSPLVKHVNCEKYSSSQFPHESGFDSYATGYVFLKICHVLAMKRVISSAHVQPQSFLQYLKAVSPFVNKLNIGFNNVKFIDLIGEEPPSSVADFIYVCPRSSSESINLSELSRIFQKYGLVELQFIEKRSALVAVSNMNCFKEILSDFKDDPKFIVTTYSTLRHSPTVKMVYWLAFIASCSIIGALLAKHAL